jgi:hypothetical protein
MHALSVTLDVQLLVRTVSTSETSGEYVAERLRSCRGFTLLGGDGGPAPQDLDLQCSRVPNETARRGRTRSPRRHRGGCLAVLARKFYNNNGPSQQAG